MSKEARGFEPAVPPQHSEQVLWITGCVVGAAHPPAYSSTPTSDEALAWYLLETTGEHAATVSRRSRHR